MKDLSVREILKSVVRGLFRLLVSPLFALYLVQCLLTDKKKTFQGYSQFLSFLPGLFGEYARREFYRLTLRKCSATCCISFGTIFSSSEVEVHDHVYLGSYCVIGKVILGENTLVASRVSLMSGIHQHGTSRLDVPMREQGGVFETIRVGRDCWIGEAAVVGADVGDQSIIAAGSVVLAPVEPCSIMRGNPATLIRKRGVEV